MPALPSLLLRSEPPEWEWFDEVADLDEVGESVAQRPDEDWAERVVRRFLAVCEHPRTRDRMLGLVKSSARGGRVGRRVYRLVNKALLNPVVARAGIGGSAVRWELVAGQMIGLGMMRYVLEVEPICSMPADELVPLAAGPLRAALG